jgi:hypothetical protein
LVPTHTHTTHLFGVFRQLFIYKLIGYRGKKIAFCAEVALFFLLLLDTIIQSGAN